MKKPKDEFDIDIQACSATDCTGLIPALPQDEAQLESYQDLYPFNPEDGSAKVYASPPGTPWQIPKTAAPPEASSGGAFLPDKCLSLF